MGLEFVRLEKTSVGRHRIFGQGFYPSAADQAGAGLIEANMLPLSSPRSLLLLVFSPRSLLLLLPVPLPLSSPRSLLLPLPLSSPRSLPLLLPAMIGAIVLTSQVRDKNIHSQNIYHQISRVSKNAIFLTSLKNEK